MQQGFEQLSKEMAVFAQNNHSDYKELQEFYLYELNLRCIKKSNFREILQKEYDNLSKYTPSAVSIAKSILIKLLGYTKEIEP